MTHHFDRYLGEVGLGTFITIKIIAKSEVGNGFQYLGIDEKDTKRIYRLIYQAKEDGSQWGWIGNDMKVSRSYRYRVKHLAGFSPGLMTPLPHGVDDLYVDKASFLDVTIPEMFQYHFYDIINRYSRGSVEEIFGFNHVYERKYVPEGTYCSSVGVLHTQGFQLQFYLDEYQKKRVKFSHGDGRYYDWPVTSTAQPGPVVASKPALLILSLDRPFGGSPAVRFEPRRCYILVVGFLQPEFVDSLAFGI